MKKQYFRPYLVIESFQVSAAIAGACSGDDIIALNQDISACGDRWMNETGSAYFSSSCAIDLGAGDENCYHGPYSAQTFLTS